MSGADAIHVRCPGNLGLLGVVLAPLFSPWVVAKYAGQWDHYRGEPWSYRLQKALLGSWWWRRGVVTVYGRWPGRPSQIIPFFTSMLTAEQFARAGRSVGSRRPGGPLRVLYVGRLSSAKHVDTLLEAVAALPERGIDSCCTVVGDGPERPSLEALVARLGLHDRVTLAGGMAFDRVLDQYERADVLVLASETEGWPKAIAEAMAFGLVCIGSNRGLVPQMLGEGRGLTVAPGDAAALTTTLALVARDPDAAAEMRIRASAWARSHTLEGLRDALAGLLEERWQVSLQGRASGLAVR
jgi:glycosyltransferase involved in cell wall biosynthesis